MMLPSNLTRIALLVVVAAAIQYFESFIYIPVAFPGVKFGFANIVTLVCVYFMDAKSTILVVILRSILGSLITGTIFSPQMLMSASGAFAAAIVMLSFNRYLLNIFSPIGISVAGAFAHIVAQLLVISLLVGSFSMYLYLPVAGNLSVITGVLNGLLFSRACPFFKIIFKKNAFIGV